MSGTLSNTQYANSSNMRKRGNLHTNYAKRSWFGWVGEKLALVPGDRVLDAGCGAGWFWNAISSSIENIRLTLLDSSTGMLEEAARNLANNPNVVVGDSAIADVEQIPFADYSFDHAIAMHMLYHVRDVNQAVMELVRVVRPGGTVTVTTNSGKNLKEIYELGGEAFGGAGQEPVAAIFGGSMAQSVLSKHLEDVTMQKFEDTYRINVEADVIDFLTSFPPGIDADKIQRTRLKELTETAINKGNGVINTRRECVLVSGKKIG